MVGSSPAPVTWSQQLHPRFYVCAHPRASPGLGKVRSVPRFFADCRGTDRKFLHSRLKFNCEAQSRTILYPTSYLPLPILLTLPLPFCSSLVSLMSNVKDAHTLRLCTYIHMRSNPPLNCISGANQFELVTRLTPDSKFL